MVAVVGAALTPVAATGAPAGAAGLPRVSVGSGSVVEGQMTRRFIRFTVALSEPATSTVTVSYATANGTATAGPDYRTKVGTATFLPGQRAKYLSVLVWPDMQVEPDETFTFTLSNPANAVLGYASGIGTVLDDDPNVGPRVSIGDVSAPEPCAGLPINASAVMTLSVRLGEPLTVLVTSAPGSATAGADYTSYSKTITFTADQNLKEVKVPIKSDLLVEGNETLTVSLTVLSGPASAGRSTGTVTILDCVPPA